MPAGSFTWRLAQAVPLQQTAPSSRQNPIHNKYKTAADHRISLAQSSRRKRASAAMSEEQQNLSYALAAYTASNGLEHIASHYSSSIFDNDPSSSCFADLFSRPSSASLQRGSFSSEAQTSFQPHKSWQHTRRALRSEIGTEVPLEDYYHPMINPSTALTEGTSLNQYLGGRRYSLNGSISGPQMTPVDRRDEGLRTWMADNGIGSFIKDVDIYNTASREWTTSPRHYHQLDGDFASAYQPDNHYSNIKPSSNIIKAGPSADQEMSCVHRDRHTASMASSDRTSTSTGRSEDRVSTGLWSSSRRSSSADTCVGDDTTGINHYSASESFYIPSSSPPNISMTAALMHQKNYSSRRVNQLTVSSLRHRREIMPPPSSIDYTTDCNGSQQASNEQFPAASFSLTSSPQGVQNGRLNSGTHQRRHPSTAPRRPPSRTYGNHHYESCHRVCRCLAFHFVKGCRNLPPEMACLTDSAVLENIFGPCPYSADTTAIRNSPYKNHPNNSTSTGDDPGSDNKSNLTQSNTYPTNRIPKSIEIGGTTFFFPCLDDISPSSSPSSRSHSSNGEHNSEGAKMGLTSNVSSPSTIVQSLKPPSSPPSSGKSSRIDTIKQSVMAQPKQVVSARSLAPQTTTSPGSSTQSLSASSVFEEHVELTMDEDNSLHSSSFPSPSSGHHTPSKRPALTEDGHIGRKEEEDSSSSLSEAEAAEVWDFLSAFVRRRRHECMKEDQFRFIINETKQRMTLRDMPMVLRINDSHWSNALAPDCWLAPRGSSKSPLGQIARSFSFRFLFPLSLVFPETDDVSSLQRKKPTITSSH